MARWRTFLMAFALTAGATVSAWAQNAIQSINSSQQAYSASCGNGSYASTLPILGDPPSGGLAFISPDLGGSAIVDKSGYRLTMAAGSEALPAVQDGCNPSGTADKLFSSYVATNQPISPGVTGTRWFFTNAAGAIFVASADVFDSETIGNQKPSTGGPLQ